jgi:hypothetical protein
LRNVFAATIMLALSTSLLLVGGTLSLNSFMKNGTTWVGEPSVGPPSLGQQVSIVPPNALSNDTDSTAKNANGTSSGDQSVAPAQSEPVPVFTNVSIMPNNVVVVVGQTFSVEVWVNNVTGMAGWQIELLWSSNVLKCVAAQVNTPAAWGGVGFDWFNKTAADVDPNAVYTAWQYGPGIVNNGDVLYDSLFEDYSATCGEYEKCEVWGPRGSDYHNTFNGSLAIVTLTFQALQAGSTSLYFSMDDYIGTGGSYYDGTNYITTTGGYYEGITVGNGNAEPIAINVYNGFVEVQDLVSFEAARLGAARALKMENGENP